VFFHTLQSLACAVRDTTHRILMTKATSSTADRK